MSIWQKWCAHGAALLALSIVAITLAGCFGGSDDDADPTVAKIDSGAVQGALATDVVSYKGLPFAAPPVGDLRWRPPQPVAPWSGVRQATTFGHECMQAADQAPLTTTPSEDCLYLNVWHPRSSAGNASAKLPVMVWIYGGGYISGGSSLTIHDGAQFAKQGVVLVSVNYRVGRFGFFGHPALTAAATQSGELLGNYGYMDQIAALKWVQRNVGAFGGDPNNVTLFGESAGGESIHNLVTSPVAKGLFQKAINESGNGRVNQTFGRYLTRNAKSVVASAEEQGSAFAAEFGIAGTDDNALKALRALSADQIVDGLTFAEMSSPHGIATFSGGSIIDGTLVVEEPEVLYNSGQFNKVPLIIGVNDADLGFTKPAATKDEAYAIFGPDNLNAARAAFDPQGSATVDDVRNQIARVITMHEPARFVARSLAAQSVPVYLYRFSYVAQSMRSQVAGAWHSAEIPYVFDTLAAYYGNAVTTQDEQVAQRMHAYWVSFAKTGDPTGSGLPAWPAFSTVADNLIEFTASGDMQTHQPDPLKPQLDLIQPLNEQNKTVNAQYPS